MDIYINNNTEKSINGFEEIIQNIIQNVTKEENLQQSVEICVTIVDNNEIREINKKFRGIDKATDVLSFPLPIGDIIIAYDKIYEQAAEYGHSPERELAFLTAHGILHVLGYDHLNNEDEKIMFSKQESTLLRLGYTR